MILLLGFAPHIAVVLGMVFFENAVLALLIYHGLMGVFLSSMRSLKITQGSFDEWGKLIPLGLLACSGVLLYVYAVPPVQLMPLKDFFSESIFGASDFVSDLREYFLRFNLVSEGGRYVLLILFLVYFSLIHPNVEQRFWRTLFYLSGVSEKSGVARKSKALWLHLCFVSYHILVLSFLLSGWVLVVGAMVLFAVSFYWNYLAKKNCPWGILVVSHILTDTSLAIAILFIVTRW